MIFWRARLVQILLSIFFLVVLGKTFYLQVFKAQAFRNASEKQIKKGTPLRLFRGEITDRNKIPLALDTARFDIYLHPKKYHASDEQERNLTKFLDLSKKKLEKLLSKSHVTKIAKNLTRQKITQIATLKIAGLDFVPVNYREYPRGVLASHVLGFVSWDKTGKSGIERFLEKELTISEQKLRQKTRIDGKLNPKKASLRPIVKSSLGKKVQLTLDSSLQAITEEILTRKSIEFAAKRATAIVMHVPTGEVLSWAVFPSFNPNKYNQHSPKDLSSWQVSEVYEPGSTFKIITIAAALENKVIDYDFTYRDNGHLKIEKNI